MEGYGGDDMNLTGRPVTPKGSGKPSKPNKFHYEAWGKMKEGGCSVYQCKNNMLEIHHAETGAGGRKDHNKTFCLCYHHHRGDEGIHKIGRPSWQVLFGTEQAHIEKASIFWE